MPAPNEQGSLVGAEVPTPLGMIAVIATPEGVVRASGVATTVVELSLRLPKVVQGKSVARAALPQVEEAIHDWLAGDPDALTRVPAEQSGGDFTRRAWDAMREVPGGQVITYQQLAARAGNPRAMRAAGQACARNALAPFIPCHRIVAEGGLGNYGYGVVAKARMLEMEGVLLGS